MEHTINGIEGCMKRPKALQEWAATRYFEDDGNQFKITVKLKLDETSRNRFTIGGVIWERHEERWVEYSFGAIHDQIAKQFPELACLIRWHLQNMNGPMHYPANPIFLAGNRDHWGRAGGEPSRFSEVIYFYDSPVHHKISSDLAEFIKHNSEFEVVTIAHDNKHGAYDFKPHHTFKGLGEKWHECPFEDVITANEWARALNSGKFTLGKIATEYSRGKARELAAARASANWPDASDEILSQEPDELRAALMARLPALNAEFRTTMESIGFEWSEQA